MKSTRTSNCVKFAACMVLVVGLSVSALASCGDSLSAMAVRTSAIASQSSERQHDSQSYGRPNRQLVHRWPLARRVQGQRPDNPRSLPTLECRWD